MDRVLRICSGMSEKRADESCRRNTCENENRSILGEDHTKGLSDKELSDDTLIDEIDARLIFPVGEGKHIGLMIK